MAEDVLRSSCGQLKFDHDFRMVFGFPRPRPTSECMKVSDVPWRCLSLLNSYFGITQKNIPPQILSAKLAPGTFEKEVGLFEEYPFLYRSYCLGALGSQTGPELPRVSGQTAVGCPGTGISHWVRRRLDYHVEFSAAVRP